MQLPKEQLSLLGTDGMRAIDEYVRENVLHANSPRRFVDFQKASLENKQKHYNDNLNDLNTLEAQGYPVVDPSTLPWYKRLFMSGNKMADMRYKREAYGKKLKDAKNSVQFWQNEVTQAKNELEDEVKKYNEQGGDAATRKAHDKDDEYLNLFNNYFWAQNRPTYQQVLNNRRVIG
jgi:hypothetical protein